MNMKLVFGALLTCVDDPLISLVEGRVSCSYSVTKNEADTCSRFLRYLDSFC